MAKDLSGEFLLSAKCRGRSIQLTQDGYKMDGDAVYRRVSSVVGIIDKSAPMTAWAKRVTLDHIASRLNSPDTMEELRHGDYHDVVRRAVDESRHAADIHRDKAASRGTAIHQEINDLLVQGGTAVDSMSDHCRQAMQFLKDWQINVVASEMYVWDDERHVAGTVDAVGVLPDSRLVVWDWKTGAGPYDTMAVQVAGYVDMLRQMTGAPISMGLLVMLREDHYAVHEVRPLPDAIDAFEHAAALHDIINRQRESGRLTTPAHALSVQV